MDQSEADLYEDLYSKVPVSGRPGRARDILHSLMERGLGPAHYFDSVLEVGANHGEHLSYVRHGFSHYYLTDLRRPPAMADHRVISTCVLHHVDSPRDAFAEIRRVTKPGGLITILIPTDPGLAYRAVRSLTTVKSARRLGIAEHVNLVHARAHHNHFWSLEKQLRSAYEDDLINDSFWPLGVKSWNANLLTVWSVRVNKA